MVPNRYHAFLAVVLAILLGSARGDLVQSPVVSAGGDVAPTASITILGEFGIGTSGGGGTTLSAGAVACWAASLLAVADLDGDDDVDAADLSLLEACASGPAISHSGTEVCRQADFDADSDIDQSDFAVFQRCFGGENVPADPNCGN